MPCIASRLQLDLSPDPACVNPLDCGIGAPIGRAPLPQSYPIYVTNEGSFVSFSYSIASLLIESFKVNAPSLGLSFYSYFAATPESSPFLQFVEHVDSSGSGTITLALDNRSVFVQLKVVNRYTNVSLGIFVYTFRFHKMCKLIKKI